MADTTYEEAARCPRCEQPGQEVAAGTHQMKGGSELRTIYCRNPRCSWCDTPWVVQVNPDGTVPPPTVDRQKSFQKLPDRTDAVQESMQRLYNQTLTGGETR